MNASQNTGKCKNECFTTCRWYLVIATATHKICYVEPPGNVLDITEYTRFTEMLTTHTMLGTVKADRTGPWTTAPEATGAEGTCHGCASYDATTQRRLTNECFTRYE